MRILFLAPYPAYESPSQRYRLEHYLGYLEGAGFSYAYKPFMSEAGWKIFFSKGNTLKKAWAVLTGFLRRWILMFTIGKYDFVYIHREAAPMGPPVFEWIIAKLYRKKIIYDYDDAIWVPAASENNKIGRYLKWFSKVKAICKMAYKVSAGNDFLADFARPYCKKTEVVPTVVDTERIHNRLQDQDTPQPAVGWTGTFSTLRYLAMIVPAVQRLQEKYDFTFIVIANKNPELPLKKYRYIEWHKEREAEDLLQMHVGLMPLQNGEIEKGKCGFKAIQYMALGIPAVVSPVGVNSQIVQHGINGFTAANDQEWEECLEKLLADPSLRKEFGKRSRQRIEEHYSVTATKDQFIKLFS